MTILQSFLRIPRSYRHIKRYREIVFILAKYGLGNIFGYTRSIGLGLFKRKKIKEIIGDQRSVAFEKIKNALEELGPAFVKFGQVMSNRPDLLPQAFIRELEKLQKDVAPFPFAQADKIIEQELKEKRADFFEEIEPNPLASGSIAQVHRASLKDGGKVVLKILRPNIAQQIETDVEIMIFLARKIQQNIPELGIIDIPAIINEFKCTIRRELDFYREISNIERFQHNFRDDPDIYVPKIYKELCSKNIIVLEYIDGYTLNDLIREKPAGIETKEIARKGANFVLKQIFIHGFFHADPHPGNILVLPDARICFIDFGMTGTLPKKFRELLADFILGFLNQDAASIVRVLKKFTKEELINQEELEQRISELVEAYTYLPLNKIDSTRILQELMSLLTQFNLKIPPVIYMLLKAMVTIEGVARRLDNEFNIAEYIRPFAKKLLYDKVNPLNQLKENYPKVIDIMRYIADIPGIAFEISEMIRDGKIKIGVEHKGLSQLTTARRKNNQMIAMSIISAAIFVSSAMILTAQIPPFWHGISAIGLIGIGLAGIIAVLALKK